VNGGSSKQGRKEPLAKHPEIGCNTPNATNASSSVRLPKALKDAAIARAALMETDFSQYIRDLIEADLSGTRPRRRRAKYDGIRQKLAEIHAAIIGCANEVKQSRGRVTDAEYDGQMITLLQDAVSALLLLARSIGPR
jgi:hypothetical protein